MQYEPDRCRVRTTERESVILAPFDKHGSLDTIYTKDPTCVYTIDYPISGANTASSWLDPLTNRKLRPSFHENISGRSASSRVVMPPLY